MPKENNKCGPICRCRTDNKIIIVFSGGGGDISSNIRSRRRSIIVAVTSVVVVVAAAAAAVAVAVAVAVPVPYLVTVRYYTVMLIDSHNYNIPVVFLQQDFHVSCINRTTVAVELSFLL